MKLPLTKTSVLSIAGSIVITLTGCGDAETTIVERDPIPAVDDGHDHGGGTPGGTSAGRLLVVDSGDVEAQVYDLADSDDTVTVAFYYDTDGSGLDGTAISGSCATANIWTPKTACSV